MTDRIFAHHRLRPRETPRQQRSTESQPNQRFPAHDTSCSCSLSNWRAARPFPEPVLPRPPLETSEADDDTRSDDRVWPRK